MRPYGGIFLSDGHDHLQLLLISSHLALAVFVVLGIRSNARTSCRLGLTADLSRLLGHTSRFLGRLVVWLSIPALTGRHLSTVRVLFQVLILEDIQSSVVRGVQMDLGYCGLGQFAFLRRIECFFPPACTQTPPHAILDTG